MARDWFWLRYLRGSTVKAVENAANFIAATLWKITDSGPEVDQENYAQAYQLSVWVAACIEAICNDCAAVPYDLLKDGEPVEEHPLLDLLARVNEEDDWAGLVWATVGYRRLTGDAYWLLIGGKGPQSKVDSIFPLRPDRVTVNATKQGIQGYTYNPVKGDRRGEQKFEAHEVIHFRRWNPLSDLYGQSSVQSIETSINLDNKIRRFNYEFLKRGAVPSGMLTAEGTVDKEQAEQVKARWRELYGGEAKAGETMVAGNNLKYTELGKNARDGQYIELAKMMREEIIAAFHVPPVRVGILDNASYASADEEEEIYWKSCIVPETKYLFGRINEKLAPRFGDDLEVVPDFSGVEALQEGKAEQAERIASAVGVPYLTPDEGRAQAGYKPLGGYAETLWQPMSMVPLGMLQPEAEQQEPTPTKAAKPVHFKLKQAVPQNKGRFGEFGSAQHAEYWKAFDRSLRPLEERFRKTMAKLYTDALDAVLAALAEEEGKHLKATVPTPEGILRDIFTDEQAERWVTGIMPHVVDGVALGAKRALADIGGGTWDIERPEVVRWLGEKRLKITTLPETMHGRLRGVLQGAVNEGVGVPEMASRIRDLKPEYQRYQAERVARTETVGANNKGCLEGYKQNDVEYKEWLTALDAKVRGHDMKDEFNHVAANGEVQPVDKPFALTGQALDHPGDHNGSAGNVINCRCVLLSAEGPAGVVPEVPAEPIGPEPEEAPRPVIGTEAHDEWIAGLAKEEAEALRAWALKCSDIRQVSRTGRDGAEAVVRHQLIDQALARAKPADVALLYRGLARLSADQVAALAQAETIALDSLQSATAAKGTAERFARPALFGGERGAMLTIKGNRTAVKLGSLSPFPDEEEFILRKGAKYVVEERTVTEKFVQLTLREL